MLLHTIHRVHFCSNTDTIKISIVGTKSLDEIKETVYSAEHELPDFIRRKIAVLDLLAVNGSVDGVGWMLSDDVYWVYETAR